MMANRREAAHGLSIIEHDMSTGKPTKSTWVPLPRLRRTSSSMRMGPMDSASTAGSPVSRCSTGPTDQVVALSSPTSIDAGQHLSDCPEGEIRFGFCAPDNRLTSLNIPAEGTYGRSDSTLSFDVEFDQDHPDRITISLMDLDEDGFIRTVHSTVQFPARLFAELLSRRKATTEEAEEWRASETEE